MAEEPTTDILVIGFGNPHRSDDGVGCFVIDQLQDADIKDATLLKMNPDGYALMEAWKDREWVIIVDAAKSGEPAGTVKQFDALTEQIPRDIYPVSSHTINLAETISLGRTLNQLPKHVIVFAIEADNLGYGSELSPEVREAGVKVARRIESLIKGMSLRETKRSE